MKLSKNKFKHKYLFSRKKKLGGRNNTGRITVAHQGGGHKQHFRKIRLKNIYSKSYIVEFEYDPNRTARLAKICSTWFDSKKFFYILAPQNAKILDPIPNNNLVLKENSQIIKQVGTCLRLDQFTPGDFIYNLQSNKNLKKGSLIKAGGTFGIIKHILYTKKTQYCPITNETSFLTESFVLVKLPSGKERYFSGGCLACFGALSNENHKEVIWGKAGKSRWLNIRPTVRGVAKNPIDHPHGGNTSGGCHPVTPWAKLTKGKPTRSKKKKFKILKNILSEKERLQFKQKF